MPQKVIDGNKFEVLDAREYMSIPDCFVLRNKTGTGHGEAKFYVGNENRETMGFFDNFDRECFFLRSDFEKYLEDAALEYNHPEQKYKNIKDLPADWKTYKKEIAAIRNEIIPFSIYRVRVVPPRVYINSRDKIYTFLRRVALPGISYLSALKLRAADGEIKYYFRLFIDYFYLGTEDHPFEVRREEKEIEAARSIQTEGKEQLIRARMGQGRYREELLRECPYCLITGVSDERFLRASHIKPWIRSSNEERLDPKNGLMLTPTYDFLFDKGFISFGDNGVLLVSPWISPMNQRRLGLSPGKRYRFEWSGRELYLKYHRENIFKR